LIQPKIQLISKVKFINFVKLAQKKRSITRWKIVFVKHAKIMKRVVTLRSLKKNLLGEKFKKTAFQNISIEMVNSI